ncbi:glutathione S-transferase 1-like [Rhodnius prolixus]
MELYYNPMSFPSRSVLLFAKALGLSLELKELDLLAGEQFAEDFIKINPQHCVPLLVDGDIALSESRAILIYLADEYAKDDSYYPKDNKERAIVNQRLFFDLGSLAVRFIETYVVPIIWRGQPVNDEMVPKVEDSFSILNTYLDGKDWLAGDQITIADYSLVTLVSIAEAIGFDLTRYENVSNWLIRCKETMEDYEELNQNGLDQFMTIYNEKLSQIE